MAKCEGVHGKLRHPESQGAVERVNRHIKHALYTKRIDNENDQGLIKYLRWIDLHHNPSYHTTIRISPCEAVYNPKLLFSPIYHVALENDWVTVPYEDDLNKYI
ncbi:KRAB-A domain-containing protein 2-like [Oopsacas minuta]|uniref:KRAB-A domain-containing protein 2-like n=1 Tax=Oopsacas minuta TaxID=111878 RepID=A0AAV7JRR7_9METZ|nr:KRAB-A domain-containing protein 2-like [Oopsacas minuta]